MSVWCTRFTTEADGFPSDGPGPLVYRGSHIIPSADGERGGSVDTAHLPGFLTRDGYDNAGDGEPFPWWPFLRLSVRPKQRPSYEAWQRLQALAERLDSEDVGLATDVRFAAFAADTVILDLAQVDALIADLVEWRANVDEERQ